jgi:hypothetical protein
MPATLPQRYADLYRKFGVAWQVTDKDSLFDYVPGTSTATFTIPDWPLEKPPCAVPHEKPAEPGTLAGAERACKTVTDENAHANCVFDVMVTGNVGFATTYTEGQHVLADSTSTTLAADLDPTQVGEWVTFTAIVAPVSLTRSGVPTGTVQFVLDGSKVGAPVRLDDHGRANWETDRLKVGSHRVTANYIPTTDTAFLPSTSLVKQHTVKRCFCSREKKSE